MAQSPLNEQGSNASLESLVEQLSNLTLLNAAELTKMLESKWGVSAAASAPAAQTAAAAPEAEQQTEFEVVLAAVGDKKLDVIKAVREVTSLGIAEAKKNVESAPYTIKSGVSKKEAEEIKAKLESVGAKIDLK